MKNINKILFIVFLTFSSSTLYAEDLINVKAEKGEYGDGQLFDFNDILSYQVKIEKGKNLKVWLILKEYGFDGRETCVNSNYKVKIKGIYNKGDKINAELFSYKLGLQYQYALCVQDKNKVYQHNSKYIYAEDETALPGKQVEILTRKVNQNKDVVSNNAVIAGKVKNGNKLMWWFDYDKKRKNVSCKNKKKHTIDYNADDKEEDYARIIANLDSNTQYYYIFCVEHSFDRTLISGEIEDFITGKKRYKYNYDARTEDFKELNNRLKKITKDKYSKEYKNQYYSEKIESQKKSIQYSLLNFKNLKTDKEKIEVLLEVVSMLQEVIDSQKTIVKQKI